VRRSSVGIATALLSAVCFAGQPSEAQPYGDRASEQRADTTLRADPPPVQRQALRTGCPGRVDAVACVEWHLQTPADAGEIVGTSSTDQGTLKSGGLDVSAFGRK
jgi:hypothetical protein